MKPPRSHVRLIDLIGPRRFTPEQRADYSARHPWAPRARPPKPGLTPYRDAVALWSAIERGAFIAPVRDSSGRLAWPIDAVLDWCRRRGLK